MSAAPPAPQATEKAFVGRDRELDLLRETWREALEKQSLVLAEVRGASGIGKTALTEHLIAMLRSDTPRPLVLRGRCFERESVPYKAFDALVEGNQDFNEECVGCHVVGFGRKGGFANAKATPELANVQCEACHGPGSIHAESPAAGYGAAGARSCLRCHDPQNSPEFDFYSYWPKIRH